MKAILSAAVILLASSPAFSQTEKHNVYVEDGLSLIKVAPSSVQKNPELTISSMSFPSSITTIGQAINYALISTGYKLEDRSQFDPETRSVLMQKLPRSQRHFEYATVKQVIESLIGNHFFISDNEVTRTIAIKFKK